MNTNRNLSRPWRSLWLLALCILIAGLSVGRPIQAQTVKGEPPSESFHPTRIIAKFKANEKASDEHPVLKLYGLKIHRQHKLQPGLVTLDLEDDTAVKAAMILPPPARAKALRDRVAKLQASGVFEYVEPDYSRNINTTVPTDSAYTNGTLWALHNFGQNNGMAGADIGAAAAWDITTGSTNVIVAVIDTGIRYTHQDLAANMWHNPGEIPGNNLDDDEDGYVDDVFGINALLAPKTNALAGNPFDDNGHGTHVAGTIGAAANDGNPHVGVAWNVRLMACKCFDSAGNDNVSDEIECINFALSKGARIINASFGGSTFSQAEFDAIRVARDMGVLFVAAAGNSAANNDSSPTYPASYQLGNILSVAALDRFDRIWHYSNVGQTNVDLAAC